MIKTFLILINLQLLALASQQIVLVVSNDLHSSKAKLECYEDGKKIFNTINVNLGKNGLAWGLGTQKLSNKHSEPIKFEGDKKSPIGIFKLTHIFGYNAHSNFAMPYLYASKKLICVDDSASPFYNQIIEANGDEKSFEYIKRHDHQYELGIVIEHNKQGLPQRGSCLFIHVQKSADSSTAGCTAMRLDEIKQISSWLNPKKNPLLIQIPKSLKEEVTRLYPELQESQLLQP